ncbi:D-alanyl-D-alanine carboxypeptidase/D-alanyl-D-alanine-endopeptidase [Amycolatopsis sp. DG1A-15b]|uniref:D-alanyl-D-alanine carboxypeptidase/D-alanyl-D-alanine endopeptidase n=1 Tax=Amycolatopsis sp. DG1A-15b TaxID=3052846 RepID=UPI00255B86AD|nr:D-alanyl-D-alanine carboxypeptidase/D-alanyl-D-alanine-endopeptidase [Amycolatopsis sp. DG1A-15b]WIX90359.1 D-alanyl-D-alanine carboxypeptidase/D-alanyl-D-alanine-endopeptidase [Amycolatopsis sp. DG1A-15b]
MNQHSRRTVLGAAAVATAGLLSTRAAAHAEPALTARIQKIITRPELAGSRWGMRFHVHNTDEPVYALNPGQRFLPASSLKVFIAGSAFDALGPSHRFRTRVNAHGPVRRGVLDGDLVLVAAGDLVLGPRLRPHGTIALPDPDHTYGSATGPIPGDPLQQLRELARQVRLRGVRRVAGRVRVDASLFRQGQEDIFNGLGPIPVSPMMVNDNVVDVVVTPGRAELRRWPETSYVTVINEVTTVDRPARRLTFTPVATNPDGTQVVRLTGDIQAGGQPVACPYFVPDPVRFAEIAFVQALTEAGVDIANERTGDGSRRLLAEHVSPPLAEQAKVMLKLSSNVHTVYFPYLVGAIAGRDADNAEAAGARLQAALFERAGLEPVDPTSGTFSPDFFVQFLRHMARQRYFTAYRDAMAILGRDGTLTDTTPGSPAAGRTFAKTGTGFLGTELHKALAGYLVLPDGRLVVFSQLMDMTVGSAAEAMALQDRAGVAQADVVTAVYESLTR